uniref:Uncharacterized protein n=1 Tax=Setaria digitata TaxID=48799 RepID=A0A915PBD3_9BILA
MEREERSMQPNRLKWSSLDKGRVRDKSSWWHTIFTDEFTRTCVIGVHPRSPRNKTQSMRIDGGDLDGMEDNRSS